MLNGNKEIELKKLTFVFINDNQIFHYNQALKANICSLELQCTIAVILPVANKRHYFYFIYLYTLKFVRTHLEGDDGQTFDRSYRHNVSGHIHRR